MSCSWEECDIHQCSTWLIMDIHLVLMFYNINVFYFDEFCQFDKFRMFIGAMVELIIHKLQNNFNVRNQRLVWKVLYVQWIIQCTPMTLGTFWHWIQTITLDLRPRKMLTPSTPKQLVALKQFPFSSNPLVSFKNSWSKNKLLVPNPKKTCWKPTRVFNTNLPKYNHSHLPNLHYPLMWPHHK